MNGTSGGAQMADSHGTRSGRVRRRPALVALALLTAGCAPIPMVGSPPDAGAPTSIPTSAGPISTSVPTNPTTEPTPSPAAAAACTVTVGGGQISIAGSGELITTDTDTSFSCHPSQTLISMRGFTNTAVMLAVNGARIAITNGATGVVGPYRVSVVSITSETAVFTVMPPPW